MEKGDFNIEFQISDSALNLKKEIIEELKDNRIIKENLNNYDVIYDYNKELKRKYFNEKF